jgi:hypothetical protein
VTTVVMLSRGFYVMKVLPYVLALMRSSVRPRLQLRLPALMALAGTAVLAFAVSLAGVLWLRIAVYPRVLGPAPPAAAARASEAPGGSIAPGRPDAAPPSGSASSPIVTVTIPGVPPPTRLELDGMTRQPTRTVVGRSIGLEGVLAVSSPPDLGLGLFAGVSLLRTAVNRSVASTLRARAATSPAAVPTPPAASARASEPPAGGSAPNRPDAPPPSETADRSIATGALPGVRAPTAVELGFAKGELTRMVVGRWIGLEGVLAISAAPDLGPGLLRRAVTEDPKVANAAMYQQISRAEYKPLSGFTFLTLPGAVGVMSYSGSSWVVLLGMMLLTTLVLGTEAAFRRVFQNDFLCAVVGVAMANAIVQMNFPYLTAVFFVELWGTLGGLWLLSRIGARRILAAPPAPRTSPV